MVHLSVAARTLADYRSLVGQSWDYGRQDCYTLVRQYFALQGVTLPDFERPSDLELTPSIYFQQAENLGFERVEFEDRRVGDVAIMRLGTREPMHAAIFVEPWRILHQQENSLSIVEALSGYYVRRIAAVYRYAAGSSAG